MTRRRLVYLAAAAVAGGIAAAGVAFVATDESTAGDRPIRVVGPPARLPAGCGVRFVARRVDAAMAALSSRDDERLAETFALGSGFRFAIDDVVGERVIRSHQAGSAARRSRAELVALVRRRRAAGETIRLLALKVAPVLEFRRELASDRVDFEIVLDRRADDLARVLGGPPGLTHGKGVLDCRSGRVLVLAVGTRSAASTDPFWPCPAPRDWEREREILTCAKRFAT